MNALNGVESDSYIQQTIIQEESQKLIKILPKNLILKIQNFQSKVEIYKKNEKRNSIDITVFGYENNEKHRIYVSKKMLLRKTC